MIQTIMELLLFCSLAVMLLCALVLMVGVTVMLVRWLWESWR